MGALLRLARNLAPGARRLGSDRGAATAATGAEERRRNAFEESRAGAEAFRAGRDEHRTELSGAVRDRLDAAAGKSVDRIQVRGQLLRVGLLAFQSADTDHDTPHADHVVIRGDLGEQSPQQPVVSELQERTGHLIFGGESSFSRHLQVEAVRWAVAAVEVEVGAGEHLAAGLGGEHELQRVPSRLGVSEQR
jgi:hypothetical protein